MQMHKIQTSIINAALKTIPNKKFTVRNFHHAFTSKATELHKDLKTIGNIMQQTKYSLSHNQPIPTTILAHIQSINSKYQFLLLFHLLANQTYLIGYFTPKYTEKPYTMLEIWKIPTISEITLKQL